MHLPDPAPILFIAANPSQTARLRLDVEYREIDGSLRRSRYRDRFTLKPRFAVTPKDLRRALLDEQPAILHVSGHGFRMKREQGTLTADAADAGFRDLLFPEDLLADELARYAGGIALQDEAGQARIVKAETLAGLIQHFPGIRCVVLCACHSFLQAASLHVHVPYVIGMSAAVPDDTAIAFSRALYDALGAGSSIPDAFGIAKASIPLEGLDGEDLPQLLAREA
jgi:hypothetical protein